MPCAIAQGEKVARGEAYHRDGQVVILAIEPPVTSRILTIIGGKSSSTRHPFPKTKLSRFSVIMRSSYIRE
jgi:hypothetical protein